VNQVGYKNAFLLWYFSGEKKTRLIKSARSSKATLKRNEIANALFFQEETVGFLAETMAERNIPGEGALAPKTDVPGATISPLPISV